MDVKSKSGLRCPRCGGPVAVGTSMVAMQFGLIGAILSQFMKTYQCPRCGKIPFKEFPPETRSKLRSGAWIGLAIILAVAAALIGFGIWMALQRG